MGGFFSMEQNTRRNNGVGAVAPKFTANRNVGNVEVANNGTRRNNGNNGRNTSRRNNANSVASDPRELEEVVVSEPPAPPSNTVVNVNRRNTRNNGRINVVATNEQVPLPSNTTPEGEEQVGGARKGKSRRSKRSKRSRRGKSKRACAA